MHSHSHTNTHINSHTLTHTHRKSRRDSPMGDFWVLKFKPIKKVRFSIDPISGFSTSGFFYYRATLFPTPCFCIYIFDYWMTQHFIRHASSRHTTEHTNQRSGYARYSGVVAERGQIKGFSWWALPVTLRCENLCHTRPPALSKNSGRNLRKCALTGDLNSPRCFDKRFLRLQWFAEWSSY